jgi:hypothetical protein
MSRKLAALADGDDFKIVIKGWDCDKQAPVKRSLPEPNPVLEKRAEWSEYDDSLNSGTFFPSPKTSTAAFPLSNLTHPNAIPFLLFTNAHPPPSQTTSTSTSPPQTTTPSSSPSAISPPAPTPTLSPSRREQSPKPTSSITWGMSTAREPRISHLGTRRMRCVLRWMRRRWG